MHCNLYEDFSIRCHAETVVSVVAYTDHFLAVITVHHKYIGMIDVTCLSWDLC